MLISVSRYQGKAAEFDVLVIFAGTAVRRKWIGRKCGVRGDVGAKDISDAAFWCGRLCSNIRFLRNIVANDSIGAGKV